MGFRMARTLRCGGQSALGVVAALLLAGPAVAQSVSVSLPSAATITGPGASSNIDVTIGSVTGLEAGAIAFVYDTSIVTATAVVTSGTLLSGCTVTPNISTPGEVIVTFACATAVNMGGVLFQTTLQGVAPGMSPLTFMTTPEIPNGCSLNEGTPACSPLTNGQVTVAGPTNTPTGVPTGTATATATATNTSAPVNTGTATGTATRTGTSTPTNTLGPSPTASSTGTVTSTGTATRTLTETATRTPTRTVTETRTVTATRPGAIPVVPSPTSPAGLVMVSGLGVALLWALRRLAKPN